MKKKNLIRMALIAVLLMGMHRSSAQGLAINTTSAAADTSAMLDVSTTSKGVLVPRMTTAQRNGISLPANSLLIYQTDGTAGFYFNSGTSASPVWTPIQSGFSGIDLLAQTFLENLPVDSHTGAPITTTVTFNAIITPPTIGSWDGSSTYTVGVTGTYLISVQITSDNALASLVLNVGTGVYYGTVTTSSTFPTGHASLTTIAYITAGTTISLQGTTQNFMPVNLLLPTNITIDKL